MAAANTAADVAHIIHYYAFTFTRYINNAGEILHFYTTNEGSGDILVATATGEGSATWRMRYALYDNGTMPSDVLALLAFIDA